MPDANFQFVSSVKFLGRDVPLLKPIAIFNARRLEALLPQIAALNAARMSKEAAAKVVGVTGQTFATWIKLTQTTWLGKVSQPKYSNPERHRANVKRWRLRHPDKVKAMKRAYYLRRKAARLAQSTHA
jgi:hypothetical protein